MDLDVNLSKRVLRFKRILPGITAGSPLHAEINEFLRRRHGDDLPDHRRIDTRRAAARCTIWQGAVTISLEVKNGDYAYGVNRIVNLVHELFVHLRSAWPEYLVEKLGVPEE
jgi:hypothetical protein